MFIVLILMLSKEMISKAEDIKLINIQIYYVHISLSLMHIKVIVYKMM